MATPELNVVTGALGYTGRYIARALLERGARVRTLTAHPARANPFGERLEIAPLDFGSLESLARSLEGASTLFNTYWIRFPSRGVTFQDAVENSRTLLHAARRAGVRRIVHISITGAAEDSPLPYFRGKGIVEREIAQSGLSYLILRPTLIFGAEDVLVNNIAWLVRRLPLFAIPGRGDYRVQPVFVADLAALAISGAPGDDNRVADAVGPEIYTFRDLVRLIARTLGRSTLLVPVPPGLALLFARFIGYALDDVTLTRDEIDGLMANLLISHDPPTCPTALSSWLQSNADLVGRTYTSELAKRSGGSHSGG
ncbi:MAG: SDR family oxidoreductase [Candidatus Binataceae bacterium]